MEIEIAKPESINIYCCVNTPGG
jgi:hypothetical protein